jgi:regulator of sigma E protease
MFEFLSHPLPAVVILLGVLVLVHELGHFLVGKACGVGVEVFSIGFGPRILGFRHNDTDYRFSWLPLGGYVKFAGTLPSEDVPERFVGRELYNASLIRKFFIIGAGPFANLLLAVAAYTVLVSVGIKHPSSVIGEVRPGSPADIAGMMSGDRIIQVGEKPVVKWQDLQGVISKSAGIKTEVKVDRDGEVISLSLIPEKIRQKNFLGKEVEIGRAGIGYGFLPPIVSLLSADSPLAKVGIKTGDEIQSVSFNGKSHEIKTWSAFLTQLNHAYQLKTSSIEISWISADKKNNHAAVETSSWFNADLNVETLSQRASSHILSKTLLVTDAQLTIMEAKGSLNSVLKKNDRLIGFDGKSIRDIYQLQEFLDANLKPKIEMKISRNGVEQLVPVELKPIEVQKPAGLDIVYSLPVAFIGSSVQPEPFIEQYKNPISALWYGVEKTSKQSYMLVSTILGLFSGEVPIKALGGPMLIAKVAGDSAKMGWQAFLTSMALISINLGMINLFPIPVLDGGQLVVVGIEAVRRKRLSEAAIENYQKIGFVMVMSLVVLATYNDLSRFWKSMVQGVVGLF